MLMYYFYRNKECLSKKINIYKITNRYMTFLSIRKLEYQSV